MSNALGLASRWEEALARHVVSEARHRDVDDTIRVDFGRHRTLPVTVPDLVLVSEYLGAGPGAGPS